MDFYGSCSYFQASADRTNISMLFDFSLKSSLLLIFFFHGLVFTLLLWIKGLRENNRACQWLGTFTGLCTLYITPFMLGYAGWYAGGIYRELLFYIPFQQLLLLPPVLFFYIRSLLDQSFVFRRQHLVHFIPAFVYGLYSLIVFITDQWIMGYAYFYADGKDKDFSPWYQMAGFISLIAYLIASLRVYKRYKLLSYDALSFADTVLFKWAKHFLLALMVLAGLRLLFFIINPEWAAFGKKFWYYLSFSALYYYISISGYINTIRSVTSFSIFSLPDPLPVQVITEEPATEYIAIGNDKEAIEDITEWKEKIMQLMQRERLYENPALTIADLADRLHTHSKKISQVINQGFEMNFNDFINTYRVEEVIRKIEAGEANSQTLMGIAYDAGFNSKSTFNRAFKRVKAITPKEFLEKTTKTGFKS